MESGLDEKILSQEVAKEEAGVRKEADYKEIGILTPYDMLQSIDSTSSYAQWINWQNWDNWSNSF